MKKNYLNKILALSLVASMAVGLAACGSEKESEKKEESKVEESKVEESKGEESQGEEAKGEDPVELQTVKILAANFTINEEYTLKDWKEFADGQRLIKELEEIGIQLEIEFVEADAFPNVVQTRMSTGTDLPDMISYIWPAGRSDTGDAKEWAQNGLIMNVSDLLEQYDEDGSILTYMKEKCPIAMSMNAQADGNLYWFSYLFNQMGVVESGNVVQLLEPQIMTIRLDWLEKIGEEHKICYTPDELFDILVKFQEEDVNGNGVKDEVAAFNIATFGNGIANGYGLGTRNMLASFFEEDSKVFSNWEHENITAYIEFMQKLYNAGLYDTAALSSWQDLVYANRASIMTGYSVSGMEGSIADAEDASYVPIIIEADGSWENGFASRVDAPMTTYGAYFIPTGAENPEGVIKLMDYVHSEDYEVWTYNGSVGYEMSETGGVVVLPIDGSKPITETNGLAHICFLHNVLPPMRVYNTSLGARENANEDPESTWSAPDAWYVRHDFLTTYSQAIDKTEYGGANLAASTEEETVLLEGKSEVLNTYAKELLTDLIMGKKKVEDLDKYVEELNELGLQDYIEVMQARRDRFIGK